MEIPETLDFAILSVNSKLSRMRAEIIIRSWTDKRYRIADWWLGADSEVGLY